MIHALRHKLGEQPINTRRKKTPSSILTLLGSGHQKSGMLTYFVLHGFTAHFN